MITNLLWIISAVLVVMLLQWAYQHSTKQKRKNTPAQQTEKSTPVMSVEERLLREQRSYYQSRLNSIPPESGWYKPYPQEFPDYIAFDGERFEERLFTKTQIEHKLRQINQELMQMKGNKA